MNVHYLDLFYRVAVHHGITQAVKHDPDGIGQPAFSAQLIKLEKELGAKLFVRRSFELTESGRVLFKMIQPFFAALPSMANSVKKAAQDMPNRWTKRLQSEFNALAGKAIDDEATSEERRRLNQLREWRRVLRA